MPSSIKRVALFNRFLLYGFIILIFMGCGEMTSVKKYDTAFFITQPISLHVDVSLSQQNISHLFISLGFTIQEKNSPLLINITTNPLRNNCVLSSASVAKENFIRISVMEKGEERYRIQHNQKEEISLADIEKVIKKMRNDLVK